jgi:chromosome segregation ATPase
MLSETLQKYPGLVIDWRVTITMWEEGMDQLPKIVEFARKEGIPDENEKIDVSAHAVITLLREAADISKENVDRAMTMAHKLSIELRAAEDRISHLEAEIDRLEVRATRAEQWLKVIKKEIEDKLIAPMEANRPELPVMH